MGIIAVVTGFIGFFAGIEKYGINEAPTWMSVTAVFIVGMQIIQEGYKRKKE
ncbi:hypothetical protein [Pontibacillus yanchengensis]|uniref:hypothetical protein n=1 Tax=Pontibacillus yanchengensis TaxID=462910 RepID=UPI001F2650BC|nr:hypothetical protein [Pontibacillus yanchengensis]